MSCVVSSLGIFLISIVLYVQFEKLGASIFEKFEIRLLFAKYNLVLEIFYISNLGTISLNKPQLFHLVFLSVWAPHHRRIFLKWPVAKFLGSIGPNLTRLLALSASIEW